MNDQQRNNTIANYSRDNLSPTVEQRNKVSARYKELCGFIGQGCFQAGSYARFTAVRPPKDLDVIWVCTDAAVKHEPGRVLADLGGRLREAYKRHSKERTKISPNEHSITIEFLDDPDEFSIDVVPALDSGRTNEFHDPIYLVPEILTMNRADRKSFTSQFRWIYSDPRGYITEAENLDERTSGRFRKNAKVAKAWKQKQKSLYDDRFAFKSFHLEQMVVRHLRANPDHTILQGMRAVLSGIKVAIEAPAILDRADKSVYIDQYVANLTSVEKALIIKLHGEALDLVTRIESAESEDDIKELMDELTQVQSKKSYYAPAVIIAAPAKPYAEE